jgi:outer membrane protein
MNNQMNIISHLFITLLSVLVTNTTICQGTGSNKMIQSTDSLSLKNIIEKVITSHPSVKAAEEAINYADARIEFARTGYYPEADLTANLSNMGPVTKLTIPSMGTFQLFPENNYSASINYRQMIYDFGRTKQNIEVENENKSIGVQTIEQVKQRLSLITVNNFYALAFLQAAIKIKDEQIDALNEHLRQVEKMMATGSATEYQVLATKVKISTVESQNLDLKASLKAQQATLNSLIGNDQSSNPVVKSELSVEIPVIPSDSLLSYAYHNRDEVLLNEKKTSLAGLRYDLIKLQNKPVINLMASGGAKNGYVPELNKIRPNYIVGLGIRIPLFDGLRNKYNLSQAQSSIASLSYESEFTKRNVSNEIIEAEAYMIASGKKVSQFELQLSQAIKAYSLAETSYKSGTITNLDLLDTNTAVSESKLMLLKARIDYLASVYKLKAALGDRIY